MSTLLGELQSNRAANPPARSRDESNTAVETSPSGDFGQQ